MSRHSKKHRRRKRSVIPGAAPGSFHVPEGAPPPVLAVMAYGPGGLVEQGIDSPAQLRPLREKWPVVWLDVHGLGDAELLRRLASHFGIHRLALADVVNVPQRPKVEAYSAHHFLVLQQVDTRDLREAEQVSLFVGKGFVLTIQEREGDWFEPVRERIRRAHGLIRTEGSDYLTYALLDAAVDSYFPALEKVGEDLEALEERILHESSDTLVAEVRHVKATLLLLRRHAWAQREMVGQLVRDEGGWMSAETRTHLRDCHDHAVQVIDLLESHRDVASSLLDLHVSVMGQRMNEVMKVLTIVATIFIPLSFVAGLYGMNFDPAASRWNMPELGWAYGYPAALLGMALLGGGMLFAFWRRGWLGRSKAPPSS